MNNFSYEFFLNDYGDIENISLFFPEESGTRTTQSEATMVETNHYSGTNPMSLISTIQQQKETSVNSTSNVLNAYCLNNANATDLFLQESNYGRDQQYEPQISSDFYLPMNHDYNNINNTHNSNINNSSMWGEEQSIDLPASNNKSLSSGTHQQPLSVSEDNHFGEKCDLTGFTTETLNLERPLYSNSSASPNYTNGNSPHQQQQLTIDTSLLSAETSNEWKLLQPHDWVQKIENYNNNQRFSSSSNQQLYYPRHNTEYSLLSSSGKSSASQQWSTRENGSYPSSSRTSLSSASLQQRSTIELQCNSFSSLSAGCMNTGIDSSNSNISKNNNSDNDTNNSTNNNTNNNNKHFFSGERSQLLFLSSSFSSVSSIPTSTKKDSYVCFFGTCRQKIGRRSDLPRHIRSKHDKVNEKVQYQCHGCHKLITCPRRDLINRHMNNGCPNKKKSSSRQPYSTARSGENDHNNDGYTIIKKPNFYCCCFDTCDKTFPNESEYENHILDHDTINKKIDIKGYCNSCGQIKCYTRIQNLKQHLEDCDTK